MADYLRPGVYVEEKVFETAPITGGQESVGAFVGYAPRGPVNTPFRVTSWTDFVNQTSLGATSPFMATAYLAYAVYGFFQNGGQSAWIVRTTDGTDVKATVSFANGATPIAFTAKDSGTWGNGISVKIANGTVASTYTVTVLKGSTVLETFANLNLTAGSATNLVTVVNASSRHVSVTSTATTMDPTSLTTKALATGTDGLAGVTSTMLDTAMQKLDAVDDINLIVSPESQAVATVQAGIAYAEKRKDCVFLFDGGQTDSVSTIQTFDANFNSDFGAIYYPWINVTDPIGGVNKTKFVPCAGHVAGMIARTDFNRGVFKAPAGVEANIIGALGVKTKVNDTDHAVLNPLNINVIRVFSDSGIVAYGARTTFGSYLNVRRELIYIMDAIQSSTRWAVFEANNEDLWRRLGNQIVEFLEARRVLGAYKGDGEGTAYFVKCDSDLNPQAEIDAGRVNTDIGVAINKPGEFIIFRVGQWDGGTTAVQA